MSEQLSAGQTDASSIDFVEAVRMAARNRGVKPKCSDCGSIGWTNIDVAQAPAVTPTLNGGALVEAAFVCKRCGHTKRYNLNVLGVSVSAESKPPAEQPAQI